MPTKPLSDLTPRWVATDPSGRPRIGLRCTCPSCDVEVIALFSNPLDHGTRVDSPELHHLRSGESFSTLSMTPELTCPSGHRFWVTLGECIAHEEPHAAR